MVITVPCLKDNYAYLVEDGEGGAAVVDPSEAGPVQRALAYRGLTLRAIWNTHHHWDHVGGVKDLLAAHAEVHVIASTVDASKIAGVTRTVEDGDEVELGIQRGRVISNPGHTLGAITYLIDGNAFTGDTLFAAGCGRIFEGDARMMHEGLMKLAALPGDTRIYCGHEYTAANLKFAAAVEPNNIAITDRAASLPTPSVPSLMSDELATNPFLRASQPAVIDAATARGAQPDPVSVFTEIRTWKNSF